MTYPADLRPSHRRVLAELARHDEISRTDLAARLDLPRATLTTLVRELIARDLVVARESAATRRRGRPAEVLAQAGPATVLGVLRPTTAGLRIAVVTVSGRVLAEDTHPISKAEFRIDTATGLLAAVAGRAGYPLDALAQVVLSVPAPYQRGVGTAARRSPHGQEYAPWALTDPAAELAERTGTRVLVENDANLGALGEHRFGAGRGLSSLIYVMLGESSVGAGLVINGWLHRGATGFAGELAHIQIDDDGPLCSCGGRGCLIHAGAALLRSAQSAYDETLTYPRILTLAAAGDAGLSRLLGDFGRSVGRPLADTCTMLNPEAIIIDGASGPGGRYIVDGIREAVTRYAAPPAAEAVTVLSGSTGDRADLLGAVVLTQHQAFDPNGMDR
ncbi:ROK family transcriptional regulator [Micromonosporaceae bacterium Da 78-11]